MAPGGAAPGRRVKSAPLVAAGAVIWRRRGKTAEFLLLRSAKGHWDFPKGRAEPGETIAETRRREIREESGLTRFEVDPLFDVRLRYVVREGGRPRRKVVHYALARWRSGRVRLSREHTAARWVALREGRALLGFPAARRLLDSAARRIGGPLRARTRPA